MNGATMFNDRLNEKKMVYIGSNFHITRLTKYLYYY
jgi:hypothetical protein